MNVSSPVNITTPFPDPYLLSVEKKAIFFDSRILFGFVHSGTLLRSSVYPVKEELSTFIPWEAIILISAGIFFPSYILITSPTTNFADSNGFSTPSRITIVEGGIKSLNDDIIASLFMFS
jgi:hypothetical protein